MRYVPRLLSPQLNRAARGFPSVIFTGLSRAGKTTLAPRKTGRWLLTGAQEAPLRGVPLTELLALLGQR